MSEPFIHIVELKLLNSPVKREREREREGERKRERERDSAGSSVSFLVTD